MWIVIKSDNYRLPQPFPLEEYKYKMLFIPLVMVNNWDWQYFFLSHKTSSIFSKLLLCTCSMSRILRY